MKMKKNYVGPKTTVFKVDFENMVAESSNSNRISGVDSGSANITYGGSSSNYGGGARTKDVGYDVWDDDWSAQ